MSIVMLDRIDPSSFVGSVRCDDTHRRELAMCAPILLCVLFIEWEMYNELQSTQSIFETDFTFIDNSSGRSEEDRSDWWCPSELTITRKAVQFYA